jgi:hypothetical protein
VAPAATPSAAAAATTGVAAPAVAMIATAAHVATTIFENSDDYVRQPERIRTYANDKVLRMYFKETK